jgi:hypothetical protein
MNTPKINDTACPANVRHSFEIDHGTQEANGPPVLRHRKGVFSQNTHSHSFYLTQVRMTWPSRLHFDHPFIILYYIILYYIILYYIILYYIILYYIILYYIILYL